MNKKVLAIATILTIVNLAGIAYATSLSGTSGNVTVNTSPNIIITAAALAGTACTVATDGSSFTCSGYTLANGPGQATTMTVTVKNPASTTQSIPAPSYVWTSTGTNTSAVLSISGPTTTININAGLSTTLTFTLTGLSAGTDSVTVTL